MKQLREFFAIYLLYLGLFFLLNTQALVDLRACFYGKGDSALYVWLTWQNIRNYLGGTLNFNLPFFYPEKYSLAFSDNYLLPSLLSTLVYGVTNNFVLSYNLPLVVASGLNGTSTYYLCRQMSDHRLGSVMAGAAFMLAPWFVVQQEHPQLEYAFFFPLIMLSMQSIWRGGNVRSSVLLGLLFLGLFFCSVYYFFIAVLLFLFYGFFLQVLSSSRLSFEQLYSLIQWNIPSLVLISLAAFPYLRVAQVHGTRSIGDVSLSISALSFIAFPKENRFWGWLSADFGNHETYFGCGIFVLALTISAVAFSRRSDLRFHVRTLILLFFVFFFLALGPITYRGKVSEFQPYVFLFDYMPGFSALRASGRFGIISLLSISLLGGIGWSELSEKFLKNSPRREYVLGAFTILLIMAELNLRGFPTFSMTAKPTQAQEKVLTSLPPRPLIALPFPRFIKNEDDFSLKQFHYMHFFRGFQFPLVNGYSGLTPTFHKLLYHRIRNFPNEGSVSRLSNIPQLEYIAYFVDLDSDFDREDFEAKVRTLPLDILWQDDELYLFRLKR